MAVPDSAIVTRLRAAGCVFAEDEARLLIGTVPDQLQVEFGLAEDTAERERVVERLPVRQILPHRLDRLLLEQAFGLATRAPGALVAHHGRRLALHRVLGEWMPHR